MKKKHDAKKLFQKFNQRPAKSERTISFPSTPKKITYLANAVSLMYRADGKMNSPRPYGLHEHKFGKAVKLYAHPSGECLYILGGKFRVNDWLRG